jgi:hypothetical protein
VQTGSFRPLPRTRAGETRDREQAFGYKAEDEYENDDEDDKKHDDNSVIVLQKQKIVKMEDDN